MQKGLSGMTETPLSTQGFDFRNYCFFVARLNELLIDYVLKIMFYSKIKINKLSHPALTRNKMQVMSTIDM